MTSSPTYPDRPHTTRRRRAPGVPPAAALGVLVFEDGQLLAARPVTGASLLLGRGADCGIRLTDPEVSRRHCRFLVRFPGVEVQDLGSVNGTFLNGRRIRAAVVVEGDRLAIGNAQVELVRLGSPEWRVHQRMLESLQRDALSGLLNQRGFRIHADAALSALPRPAEVHLLLLELGRFERFTACHGAAAGDDALRRIADLLVAEAGGKHCAGRIGPAQFAMLLAGVPAADARAIAGLVSRVGYPPLSGQGFALRMGGASSRCPPASVAPLIAAADRGLYRDESGLLGWVELD